MRRPPPITAKRTARQIRAKFDKHWMNWTTAKLEDEIEGYLNDLIERVRNEGKIEEELL